MKQDPIRIKRKIQQMGSSTLAVSVPADWAKHHEITKGDEVIIQRDENGGSLLIVPPDPSVEDSKATIDVAALSADSLERAVVTQYVLGRQLIHIKSNEAITPTQRHAVFRAEQRLMGLGIVEEGETSITVRCSVAPTDFDLPTLLRRLGRTEATMQSNAIEALLAGDDTGEERMEAHSAQLEKLFYLFLRIVFATYRNPRLNQAVGLSTGFPLIGFRSAAQDIRLMGNIAGDLAELAVDGTTPPPTTATKFTAVDDSLKEATELIQIALTTPDYEATEDARDALQSARDDIGEAQEHIEQQRPEPLLELQQALVLLKRSLRHAEDSLEVATHLTFRDDPYIVS